MLSPSYTGLFEAELSIISSAPDEKPDEKIEKPLTIESFIAEYSPKITAALLNSVSKLENKDTIVKHISKGKMLRGKLSLLAYFAAGGNKEADGLKIAAVSELAQSASLLKDDIIDKDTIRRGAASAWVEQGPLGAMNSADMMIITGLDTLVDFGAALVKTFVGGWKTAWNGEANEFNAIQGLENLQGPFYTFYLKTIRQKTASLFTTASKLGAQAATTDNSIVNTLALYADNLGMAYQLTDDLCDMKLTKLSTIPKIGVASLAQIEDVIKQGVIDAASGGKFNLGQLFVNANIDAKAFYQSQIDQFATQAMDMAKRAPNNKYKPLLEAFPRYCIQEMLSENKLEKWWQ